MCGGALLPLRVHWQGVDMEEALEGSGVVMGTCHSKTNWDSTP